MTTEYSKPWNHDKIWYDHDNDNVVIKSHYGWIKKFQSYCSVDIIKDKENCDEPIRLKLYNPDNKYVDECEEDIIEIDDRCNGDFITGLRKAFEHLKKKQYPYLCPSCKFGQFFRTVKSAEGIPYDTQFLCIDRTKKREYEPHIQEHLDEMRKLINTPYPTVVAYQDSMLEWADGPGGWDGMRCPNYIERKPEEGEGWSMSIST